MLIHEQVGLQETAVTYIVHLSLTEHWEFRPRKEILIFQAAEIERVVFIITNNIIIGKALGSHVEFACALNQSVLVPVCQTQLETH